jgi:hypothetical protein
MSRFYEFKRTLSRVSAADRDQTLRRLADTLSEMQRRWPRQVDFSGLLPNCGLAIFPLFFVEAFGQIDEERLVPFLAGCKLMASSLMIADSLYDEQLERDEQRALFLRWQGMQFELDREFAKAFAPDSPFWDALQAALAEHLRGIVHESTYSTGRRCVGDATPSECVAIALAKSCVSRVAIVGLSLLGDDDSRTGALLESLDKYNLARQIWDDLQDWKADLWAMRATLVTQRLAPVVNVCAAMPDVEATARKLYYGGHADELLELARTNLASALDAAGRDRRLPWHSLVEDLDRSVEALQRDLQTVVRRNLDAQSRLAASA